MRSVARGLLAGGLGFAVSLLAACGGSSGLLSSDQSGTLNGKLNQISSAVAAHDCAGAAAASQNFGTAVADLPATVNTTLRSDLVQGASTVSDLAVRDCHTTTAPTTPTATTATATTATTTSPTNTSTTTTTTTHSNPPPTTSTSTHTTSSGGTSGTGGNGNGNGQGNGGSGQGNGNPTGGAGVGSGH